MAARKKMKVTKDEVTHVRTSMKCVLCNEDLKSPKLLPCHHSCCTDCLTQHLTTLEEQQEFTCPVCDLVIPLKGTGIGELPANVLSDILKEYDGEKTQNSKCSSCAVVYKEEAATHTCLDCGDGLCKTCSEFHCRPISLRHHLVMPLVEIMTKASREEFKARKTKNCDKHSKPSVQMLITNYCESCKVLVCMQCIIENHQGHFFKEIQEVSKTHKDILLKRAQGDISKRTKMVESAMSMLDCKQKEQEDYICDKATKVYELTERIKQEKLNQIKEHYEKEKKALQKVLEKENATQKRFESTFNFVQDFTEFSTNVDFLQNKEPVISRFDEIQKQAESKLVVRTLKIESQALGQAEAKLREVMGRISEVENTKEFKCRLIVSPGASLGSFVGGAIILGSQAITDDNRSLAVRISNPYSYIDVLDSRWGQSSWPLPPELKKPTDIYVKGNISYISDVGGKEMKVAVLEDGRKLLKMYKLPECEKKLIHLGVCVNSKNEIFISTQTKIYKCAPNETQPIEYLSLQNENGSKKVFICMTPNDELVVSGHGAKAQVFNSTGQLVMEYGGAEFDIEATGQVTCDDESYIYIADTNLKRIMVVRNGRIEGFINVKSIISNCSSFTIASGNMLLLSSGRSVYQCRIWDCWF